MFWWTESGGQRSTAAVTTDQSVQTLTWPVTPCARWITASLSGRINMACWWDLYARPSHPETLTCNYRRPAHRRAFFPGGLVALTGNDCFTVGSRDVVDRPRWTWRPSRNIAYDLCRRVYVATTTPPTPKFVGTVCAITLFMTRIRLR